MRRIAFLMMMVLATMVADAQTALKKVYDESIDPMEQIDKALAEAKASQGKKYVMCQVGGNWCPWCLRFADFISKDSEIAQVVADHFVYIHVNYNPRKSGGEEQAKAAAALMRRLGNPQRFGFPVFVLMDANGNVLHIQDSSFLEEGKGYSKEKVLRFFKAWTPQSVGDGVSGIATVSIGDNDVIKTIMSRRTIRQYKDTPVEHEKLQQLALCGIHAPNGMNSQKWAVRVVESKQWIDGLTALFKKANPDMVSRDKNFKNMFRNAPNVICVATPDGASTVDAGMLGENIMLAAQSLGLGTCCLGGPVRFLNTHADCKPYLEKLGLPEGYQLCFIIAVGYPDEQPNARSRDLNKIGYVK